MATVTSAASALLGLVENSASSVTRTVTTITRGVDMLDRYAAEQQRQQALRIAMAKARYQSTLSIQTKLAIAEEEKEIQMKLDSDPQLKKHFMDASELVDKAMAEALAELN